jgi:nucleolar protein 12
VGVNHPTTSRLKRKRDEPSIDQQSSARSPANSSHKRARPKDTEATSSIKKTKQKASKHSAKLDHESSEDNDSNLEQRYLSEKAKISNSHTAHTSPSANRTGANDDRSTSVTDSEGDDELESSLAHESTVTAKQKKSKGPRKELYVPEGETSTQRDARTIFIGNVPAEIVKNRVCIISCCHIYPTTLTRLVSPCRNS